MRIPRKNSSTDMKMPCLGSKISVRTPRILVVTSCEDLGARTSRSRLVFVALLPDRAFIFSETPEAGDRALMSRCMTDHVHKTTTAMLPHMMPVVPLPVKGSCKNPVIPSLERREFLNNAD